MDFLPIGDKGGVLMIYVAGVEPAALCAITLISYSWFGCKLLTAYVLVGGISVPTEIE